MKAQERTNLETTKAKLEADLRDLKARVKEKMEARSILSDMIEKVRESSLSLSVQIYFICTQNVGPHGWRRSSKFRNHTIHPYLSFSLCLSDIEDLYRASAEDSPQTKAAVTHRHRGLFAGGAGRERGASKGHRAGTRRAGAPRDAVRR